MSYLCILGRQPAIGLAELESLYGSAAVRSVSRQVAEVDVAVDFARLGSSVKYAEVLTSLPTTNPQKVFQTCQKLMPDYLADFPEGKIKLGASLYGLDMPLHKLGANLLTLKKILRNHGRSARVVPNTDLTLSSAQTYHNQLAGPRGCELVLVRDDTATIVGRVVGVQDIDSYTLRDRGRPKRDAFVGMLPPKLAQTIINLATGPDSPRTILDPFCGTGVVLQEALLMGYAAYGTDLSPKMIDYSRANLEWLTATLRLQQPAIQLAQADATSHTWDIAASLPLVVAGEGYLGQPLGGQHPTPEKLTEVIADCDSIMQRFLQNIASQLPSGSRLCIAAPAWIVDGQTHYLPVVEKLEAVGYQRHQFTHVSTADLVYHRDDQTTGRDLLVLTKT